MIYNNYNNPQINNNTNNSAVNIYRFLSRSNHSLIIIITRSAQVKQNQCFYIQKLLNIQESLEILSNISGRKNIQNNILKQLEDTR
jgi:hypothetical protein